MTASCFTTNFTMLRLTNMEEKIKTFISELKENYPTPKIELENWENPFQLMICVVLSAQSTDISVNKVTKQLFKKYKTPKDFSVAKPEEVAKYIKSINYYKTKANRLIEASKYIHNELKDNLPTTINNWIKVPGVGRKSANVMLSGQGLEAEGIVVDTHVTRMANRLGLTSHEKDAKKIEDDLKKIIPQSEWGYVSKSIVLYGRYICKAKKPACDICKLKDICEYYKANQLHEGA